MIAEEIRETLLSMQDLPYRDFQIKLIPTIDPETMIGIRTPALRQYAKKLMKRGDISLFLQDLPHRYFDENQLHAFILSGMKDYAQCMSEVIRFLPYVDNWATCDQMSPKCFKKHREELQAQLSQWLTSGHTYTVRFAVGMLMEHFLEEDYNRAYPEAVSKIRSQEYYVNMMIAWYFATALAKQYKEIIPYIEERRLPVWVHNKTISKAVESYRITDEQKTYLRSLRTGRQ